MLRPRTIVLEAHWETGIPLLEDPVTTRIADSLLAQGLAQLVR